MTTALQPSRNTKKESFGKEEAAKYLSLYLGESDHWVDHIDKVWQNLVKKNRPEEAKLKLKKILACAIMLPAHDKSKIPDNPENLLYWCSSWQQFNERDWVADLLKTMAYDDKIEQHRYAALGLGVVHPIEYSPITRQAFNWLYTKAEETGSVTDTNRKDIEKRFRNVVLAYGGEVVCNVFRSSAAKGILNWRTGYFFERAIFKHYSIEQVLRIKSAELKKTNPKLIKTIMNLETKE